MTRRATPRRASRVGAWLLAIAAVGTAVDLPRCDEETAFARVEAADSILVGERRRFARAVRGVVSFADGGDDGLHYATFMFDAREALPDGACEIGTHGGESVCRTAANVTSSVFLGPRDVLAFIGCTPPPVHYFGVDVDLTVRIDDGVDAQYYPGTNVGDAINGLRAFVPPPCDDADDDAGSPYDREAVALFSADSRSADATCVGFEAAGAPRHAIATRELDSKLIRLWRRATTDGSWSWRDSRPDLLTPIVRVSLPKPGSDAAVAEYVNKAWPARLYLAHDDENGDNDGDDDDARGRGASAPAPAPVPRAIDSNDGEVGAGFASASLRLRAAVVRRMCARGWRYRGAQEMNYTALGFYDDWEAVLARGASWAVVFSAILRRLHYSG